MDTSQLVDNTYRPSSLDEFIGQGRLIEKLKVSVAAAKKRKETIDHVFLAGPAGFGKTSLAFIIAKEFKKEPITLNAANIQSPGEMIKTLLRLKEGDILFIDEIHNLELRVQEVLLSALEDFKVYLTDINDPGKAITINLKKFTMIAATTRPGKITEALRDRFGLFHTMEIYDISEIKKMIHINAEKMKLKIKDDCLDGVAVAARGVPRLVNRTLRRLKDLTTIENKLWIDKPILDKFYSIEHLSSDGLGYDDIRYLKGLYTSGFSAGLNSIASILNLDVDTVSQKIEPFLIHMRYIVRKKSGRQLTARGIERVANVV